MAFSNENAVKLGGVKKIILTPRTGNEGATLGSDKFELENVVGDTVSITQDDPEVNEIAGETKDEPIYENITQGKFQIAMENIDVQADILAEFFQFDKSADGNLIGAFKKYSARWAQVEIVFIEGTNQYTLVCPRVKLASKVVAESLKTGVVRANISGTCYSTKVEGIKDDPNYETPFYIKHETISA